jgi:hypothetical protein
MEERDDQIAALRAVVAENEAAMEHMHKLVETLRVKLAQQQSPFIAVECQGQSGKKPQQQQRP